MAAADVDRDGEIEFYVASAAGLWRLDMDGNDRWRVRDAECHWHVEADASLGVVVARVSDPAERFVLRVYDCDGIIVGSISPKHAAFQFRLLSGAQGDRTAPWCVVRGGRFVGFMDREGTQLFEYTVPNAFGRGFGIEAVCARLWRNRAPVVAVLLGTRSAWRRSVLCVFSDNGELLYQEVLGESDGLASDPLRGGDREDLLVGDGQGRVLRYRAPS